MINTNYPVLFNKYVVSKDYNIKECSNGKERIITDLKEAEELFESFQGSLCFTRDTEHRGWVHKLIFIVQLIHSWVFRRRHADINLCHAAILLQKASPTPEFPRPFAMAHAHQPGIYTFVQDYLQDEDVTELVIYRPVSENLRKEIKQTAQATAFDEILAPEENDCKIKPAFSYVDIVCAFFHNQKHRICTRSHHFHTPSKKLTDQTAQIVADMILGNQILTKKGTPRPLFCSPYAAYVLQGSLFRQALRTLDPILISQFTVEKGVPLGRNALAEKIARVFASSKPQGEVENTLHQLYRTEKPIGKLARYDSRFVMSAYLAKDLDKLSGLSIC